MQVKKIDLKFQSPANADIKILEKLNNIKSVKDLLIWILDDDASTDNAVGLFTRALENLNSQGNQVFKGKDDNIMRNYRDDLISLINGSLIERLSLVDLNNILEVMLTEKIIFEGSYKTCKTKNEHREFCIQMFKSVRRGKPEWPFMLIDSIKTLHTVSRIANFEEKENVNRRKLNGPQFHSDSNIPKCPSVMSGLKSVSSSSCLSDNDDLETSSSENKLYLPNADRNFLLRMYLLQAGTISQENITDTEPDENCQRDFQSSHSFSDCDSSDEESSTEKMDIDSETPSLNLRNYQLELAKNALKGENTIIWAPTGSGKTRVAVYILLSHLETHDVSPTESKKKRVAFLAKTVPLVNQQYRCLFKYLPKKFKVTHLTGDSENSTNLHNILPGNDVIVMTPRILENHLKKKCVSLADFSMIVFDECHHTRCGEPFNCLMLEYIKIKFMDNDTELPQVIGLTASISIENALEHKGAVKNILKICGNLDASSISTVEKHMKELKELVPVPEEVMFELIDRGQVEQDQCMWKFFEIISELEKITEEYASKTQCQWLLQHTKVIPVQKSSQRYGQWAVNLLNKAKTLPRGGNDERNLAARILHIAADFLIRYNTALDIHNLVQLRDVMEYLDDRFKKYILNEKQTSIERKCLDLYQDLKDSLSKQQDLENPNLTKLKDALKISMYQPSQSIQEDKEKNKPCGIIFVRTRALASALVSWLNRSDDQEISSLKAAIFTGTSAPPEQGGMSETAQDNVIRKFKNGEVRLLVSTSVGEEGLDIPECNVVIKYNHIGNEVSTIQTRGQDFFPLIKQL